jgi:hypothetical protein
MKENFLRHKQARRVEKVKQKADKFKSRINPSNLDLFTQMFKGDEFDKLKASKNKTLPLKEYEAFETRINNALQLVFAKIDSCNTRQREPNNQAKGKQKKETKPRAKRDRKRPEVPLEQLELLKKRLIDINGKQRYEIFVNRLCLDPKTETIDIKMFTKEQIDIIEECLTMYEIQKREREARGEPSSPRYNNIEPMCLDEMQDRHNNIENCAILSNIFDDSNVSESLESSDESSESKILFNFRYFIVY